ncbi:hypothetical protein [Nocardia arthritidis]|uniref:Uncharacterized protein n=1 Tax=Nocardia arthritidis TaxID=228602 RepID=A0A6G9YGE6_9NOCA|nr:hypothetical protein [Nocardia arthritidis]QIS12268.1 hypothetical protein F5544_22030 [Nocardia arthritidis]
MTTISHVRGCNPQSMLDFAQDLTTKNNEFTVAVDQMAGDVDIAMDSWQGKGAAAAAERALAHKLSANHLSETVVSLIDHTNAFGTELSTHRTSLLDIVDREVKQAGMTVDDSGNVTAPKVPQGGPDSATWRLLQQSIDGRAASMQSRIKALLTKFGDAETKAAQAIAGDMRLLSGYEKSPDKAPIGPRVQSILDGKTLLPTDPKQLHDFWQTLTPAEKDALWQHDKNIGNLDGLPAADRDHYNRMNLDYQLSRAQAGDPKYQGGGARRPGGEIRCRGPAFPFLLQFGALPGEGAHGCHLANPIVVVSSVSLSHDGVCRGALRGFYRDGFRFTS